MNRDPMEQCLRSVVRRRQHRRNIVFADPQRYLLAISAVDDLQRQGQPLIGEVAWECKCNAAEAAWREKCLSLGQILAIFKSVGMPLGECRVEY